MKVQDRKQMTKVPDGWSVTDIGTNTLHVKVQKTLEDGSIIRWHLKIPKDTAADHTTWNGDEEVIYISKEDLQPKKMT